MNNILSFFLTSIPKKILLKYIYDNNQRAHMYYKTKIIIKKLNECYITDDKL